LGLQPARSARRARNKLESARAGRRPEFRQSPGTRRRSRHELGRTRRPFGSNRYAGLNPFRSERPGRRHPGRRKRAAARRQRWPETSRRRQTDRAPAAADLSVIPREPRASGRSAARACRGVTAALELGDVRVFRCAALRFAADRHAPQRRGIGRYKDIVLRLARTIPRRREDSDLSGFFARVWYCFTQQAASARSRAAGDRSGWAAARLHAPLRAPRHFQTVRARVEQQTARRR
jgi:hypothetical protein